MQPAAWWIEALPSRAVLLVSVAILFLVALVLAVLLWPFNLDDKWVYYRISRIVLFPDGVPNYNAGEWFNVNTSFYILISHCQGPFLGDFRPTGGLDQVSRTLLPSRDRIFGTCHAGDKTNLRYNGDCMCALRAGITLVTGGIGNTDGHVRRGIRFIPCRNDCVCRVLAADPLGQNHIQN